MYSELPIQTEAVAKEIVDIAFKIHKDLGPGLLESVYEKCFCYELEQREIDFERQQPVEIVYDRLVIENTLRINILVENNIIIELKAQENYHPI